MALDLSATFPGIDNDPLVNGGEPSIIRTRIPVWVLVRARQLGLTESILLANYPTLRAEDLVNAWAYYQANKEEIDKQIVDNDL